MVNLEHKLTVDDLIVEYMMYKVKNGYEPSFLTSEFISFLYFFESKMSVVDSIYENDKLFTRFFERKAESDWSRTVSWITKEKEIEPHRDMVYSEKDNDYLIRANYKLSDFDRSVINTYFMPGGQWGEGKTKEIRNIIGEYTSNQQKRQLDESVEIDNNDLIIGQYVSAEIVVNIWESYIKKMIENHRWPRQCSDINKYLFQTDLAEIIGVESIKNNLIQLFNDFSKRIALDFGSVKPFYSYTTAFVYGVGSFIAALGETDRTGIYAGNTIDRGLTQKMGVSVEKNGFA